MRRASSTQGRTLDCFSVHHVLDSTWAGPRVAALARRFGFGSRARAELAIVVSELVTNAAKFAGTAQVTVRWLEGDRGGFEVIVEDHGPGVPDPLQAIVDGYSEGAMIDPDRGARKLRGLGSGLSAVRRLSDELQIESPEAGGTRVIARKYAV